MKRLLTLSLSVVILTSACNYNHASNFHQTFNASLTNGNITDADSILNVWSRKSPADPELFAARFNLFLSKSRNEMLVLSGSSDHEEGEGLAFTDSLGNVAGYISGKTTWQDVLVDSAFFEIDRGIAAHPDRIDFRLGKAAAGAMTGRWNCTIDAINGAIDRDKANHSQWITAENAKVTDTEVFLADAIYDHLAGIQQSGSSEVMENALPVVAKAAQRFIRDNRIINIAGAINYCAGHTDTAISYFEKAMEIAPNDALPLTNIAYIRYEQGDASKALEIYRQIKNGNYDDDSKNIATEMIDIIGSSGK